MGVLIDTCIRIDLEQGRLHPEQVSAVCGDRPVYLSPVTLAGAELAPNPALRQKRLRTWRRMTRKPVIPIDAGTAEVFGELAAHLAADGKRRHQTRVQDLWMASQAVPHGLELMTRNQNDFLDIPGVDLILPKETRP